MTGQCLLLRQARETYTAVQDNFGETLRIPEKLVDIIITDDLVVILFSSNELAFGNFISLVSHEVV